MERLFFLLQHSKQLKRQIQLLKTLSNQELPLCKTELAKQIGCTKPTLLNDINMLNSKLADGLKIEKKMQQTFQLVHQEDVAIDFYISQMARESLVFQLIDAIFRNELSSFNQAQEKLYVSQTTLKNIVSHINTILADFQIKISQVKPEFVGEETDIRLFLFSFYADFQDAFVNDEEQELYFTACNDLLATEEKNSNMQISFFRLSVWLMVIKQRLFGKHSVNVTASLQEEIQSKVAFLAFDRVFRKVMTQRFGVRYISQAEAIWAYITSLHCMSYGFVFEETTQLIAGNYRREEKEAVLAQVATFLKPMLGESKKQTAWVLLEAYLVNLRLLSQLSPLFAKISFPLQDFVAEADAHLYQQWLRHMEQYGDGDLFPLVYQKDIATTLTLIYSATYQETATNELTILFSFQGEAGYDVYLARNCQSLLDEQVKPFFVFEKLVTKEMLEKLRVDLVVCNYDLPLHKQFSYQIVRLSYIPTVMEWALLKKRIEVMKKNQKNGPVSF